MSSIDHQKVLTEKERVRNLCGSVHHFTPNKSKSESKSTSAADLEDEEWGNALIDQTVSRRRNSASGSGAVYTNRKRIG